MLLGVSILPYHFLDIIGNSYDKVIRPVESHPSVILHAIASRDLFKAQKAKNQYGFAKAYGSYYSLLDDSDVDIVYISTPNGLHYEWAAKSLKAGKHVLCEKPFTANAEEAKELTKLAKDRGLIIEEAVCSLLPLLHCLGGYWWCDANICQLHWQFHPASHAWRQLLDSKKYGKILATRANMTASPSVPSDDIRWQFDQAGILPGPYP